MRRRLLRLLWLCVAVLGVAPLWFGEAVGASHGATVDIVEIEGLIDPPLAEYLLEQITRADRDRGALILRIDSPGTLSIPLTPLLDAAHAAPVPVVAWVAPRGAEARAGAAAIALAADATFMSDDATIGPVPEEVSSGSVAAARASPLSATDAVAAGLGVEGIAVGLPDVLRQVDGGVFEVGSAAAARGTVTLETWDEDAGVPTVAIRFQDVGAWRQLLHVVTDPEFAFLLFLLGMFGIIFELYNPGIGLAALLGAIALLLGLYAFTVLPTNWPSVLLLVLGVLSLSLDLQTSRLGRWSLAGLTLVVLAGASMLREDEASVSLQPWAVVAAVALTLLFFISVMTAALRVRLRRPITSEDGVIGAIGEAKTDIAPEGTVLTNGTVWRARTMETGIAAGERVKIMASEGLVLLVEPLHEAEATNGNGDEAASGRASTRSP